MGCSCSSWMRQFLCSSVGRKAVMAVTGVILFLFIVGHLVGNLQVFLFDEGKALNSYAALLKSKPALLWGARITMLFTVLVHIFTAVALWLENRAARPTPYVFKRYREANYASRTMIVSGPLIGLYVVYHLLHFTTGTVHPDFNSHEVYRNVILGFQNPAAAGVYIAAMLLLGTHLYHGLWSMCQSIGANHPKYNCLLTYGSAMIACVITLGYVSIPVSVLAGILK